jgi:hypothetical protein
MKSSNGGAENSAGVTGAASASGITAAVGPMMAQEFRRGVKRVKAHCETLKKDEGFRDWNRGFVATARMHHAHLVLDENYIPPDDITRDAFKEMQIFMYAVLEEHLQTLRKFTVI